MAAKVLRFGVLGPLEMTVDAKPVPLGTPKQRAVLAMLVINRNQPVAASSLISAAWEGWPPPGAEASIHSYVSEIRRLLGDAGVDSYRAPFWSAQPRNTSSASPKPTAT